MDLNEAIREKLEEIDPLVFYGMAGNLSEDALWNYIVFFRERRRPTDQKTGKTYVFHVAIVRENEIPEGLDDQVIEKVREIPGVKVEGDASYSYTEKRHTGASVEVLDIPFIKAVKGG